MPTHGFTEGSFAIGTMVSPNPDVDLFGRLLAAIENSDEDIAKALDLHNEVRAFVEAEQAKAWSDALHAMPRVDMSVYLLLVVVGALVRLNAEAPNYEALRAQLGLVVDLLLAVAALRLGHPKDGD